MNNSNKSDKHPGPGRSDDLCPVPTVPGGNVGGLGFGGTGDTGTDSTDTDIKRGDSVELIRDVDVTTVSGAKWHFPKGTRGRALSVFGNSTVGTLEMETTGGHQFTVALTDVRKVKGY